ncbi:hypothetical protein HR17_07300 [Porphyromonas gulae]|uniref:Uncharacterized protein n=1 Tax=Porphyromonas gulae TaxID=111105 RepID=A0A099X0Z1_9PORP|nr:hypothetical protein HQ49_01505 [Porphyromonas gulae]KGN73139.1 hypothetical protein HR17_07300 [Porphyromonas gulae]KGN87532.1 hypothetical protein HR08_01765 [Porphyromonas gulae]KGO03732.1 hypothetical protein HR16_09035 [Porphyromonas gulae]
MYVHILEKANLSTKKLYSQLNENRYVLRFLYYTFGRRSIVSCLYKHMPSQHADKGGVFYEE